MAHSLHIELYCEGDPITALSEAKKIAEVRGDFVKVNFYEGFYVTVYPDSKVTDSVTIYRLKKEIKDGEKEEE